MDVIERILGTGEKPRQPKSKKEWKQVFDEIDPHWREGDPEDEKMGF